MLQPIEFWIPGEPKGQPRAKACRRGKHAGVYDPGTANEWKAAVYEHAKAFIPETPLNGPLRVDFTFYFPRPKDHYRTGKYSGLLKDRAPLFHISKPDRDNADKAVLDQLTVSRMWLDDCQVCDGRIIKRYANREPGCLVRISEASPQ